MFSFFKKCYQRCFPNYHEENRPLLIDENNEENISFLQSVKNLFKNLYRWSFRREALDETSIVNTKSVKVIKKIIFEDFLAIANTYGLAFAISLYERVMGDCDPARSEDQKCTAAINMRAGYIGLSLASADFIFRLAMYLIDPKWKKKSEQIWNFTKDITGKYGFTLQFILFLHTQIAIMINTLRGDQESKVMTSNLIFAMEGIIAGIIAIFGNDLLRKLIDYRSFIIDHDINAIDDRNNAKKLSDASFNAFFGFALGRGAGDTLRGLAKQNDSKAWMIERYVSGVVFFAIQFALAWKQDPAIPLQHKTNIQKTIFYITQTLTIAFFGTALIENITKNNPDSTIQSISLILLIILSSLFSTYVIFYKNNLSHEVLEHLFPEDEDSQNNNNNNNLSSSKSAGILTLESAEEISTNIENTPLLSNSTKDKENEITENTSDIDNLFMQAFRPRVQQTVTQTLNKQSLSNLETLLPNEISTKRLSN